MEQKQSLKGDMVMWGAAGGWKRETHRGSGTRWFEERCGKKENKGRAKRLYSNIVAQPPLFISLTRHKVNKATENHWYCGRTAGWLFTTFFQVIYSLKEKSLKNGGQYFSNVLYQCGMHVSAWSALGLRLYYHLLPGSLLYLWFKHALVLWHSEFI